MSSMLNNGDLLDPELQEEVANCNVEERLIIATKLERWAEQIRMSAFILGVASGDAMTLPPFSKSSPEENPILN